MAQAQQANPFADFSKFFGDVQVPNVDYSGIFTAQRRNLEALSAANQVVTESFRAISRRQAEIVQDQFNQVLNTSRDLLTNQSPEANASRQAELVRNIVETGMNNARELTEMASKSNVEAIDVLNRRFVESIEEVSKATGTK